MTSPAVQSAPDTMAEIEELISFVELSYYRYQKNATDELKNELDKDHRNLASAITRAIEAAKPEAARLQRELDAALGALRNSGAANALLNDELLALKAKPAVDLGAHIDKQRIFSEATFGPGARTKQITDHIRKELLEIEADPTDLEEWADVVLLALDGAWRTGKPPIEIAQSIVDKWAVVEGRAWPDWRTIPEGQPIEHIRAAKPAVADAGSEGLIASIRNHRDQTIKFTDSLEANLRRSHAAVLTAHAEAIAAAERRGMERAAEIAMDKIVGVENFNWEACCAYIAAAIRAAHAEAVAAAERRGMERAAKRLSDGDRDDA